MRTFKYIKSVALIALCSLVLTTSNLCTEKVVAEPSGSVQTVEIADGVQVKALDVVANPKSYLNKTVIINAKFDKFATLGLDYKPAFKSSEDYISFLIKRNDTEYDIPLSEMKIFLKRDIAEKYIELKTNDEICITGIVFSDALGDAWVEAKELVITKKAPEKDGVN